MSLTLKHIEKDGHEHVSQCEAVSFFPKGHDSGSKDGDIVIAYGCHAAGWNAAVDQNGSCIFGDGTLYVMNDQGATVSKYIL